MKVVKIDGVYLTPYDPGAQFDKRKMVSLRLSAPMGFRPG